MMTLARVNTLPSTCRRAFTPWGFRPDDFFRPFMEAMNSPMRTNVKETENAYLFDAELPGFTPEEIELTVHDGVLTVAAERKEGNEDEHAFAARSVRRSFTLYDIDEEHISALHKNGVLRVTLPKASEEGPAARKITVSGE